MGKVPVKHSPRSCEEMTQSYKFCSGSALAFIDRPVCFAHATPDERKQNRRLYDAYINANMEGGKKDLPDDVIIKPHGSDHFSVTCGFRPDVVNRFSRVAGSVFVRADGTKYWLFPNHRLAKVLGICREYFAEIVMDGMEEVDIAALPSVAIWRRVSA